MPRSEPVTTWWKFQFEHLRMSVKKKTAILLLTATATATALTTSTSSSSPNFVDGVLNALLRPSRAFFTVAFSALDYKYNLQGLLPDSDEYRRTISEIHLRSAKRVLELCQTNKGLYVKAGQFVAALRQIPKEYASTLSSLQDQAQPCPFNLIKEVLLSNFGQDLSAIFLSFEEQPIAAASIAQVHRAILKDKQEVAIKVQYPGVGWKMKLDIMTISFLSKSVARLFPEYRFHWLVEEFSKAISMELDFIQEAQNAERTANNFKNNDKVMVPKVFWGLTTKQVLTMQFCKGNKVDDVEYFKRMGIDPLKVAKTLVQLFAEMIFVHGWLHGDPHPGNILVSPEGKHGFTLVLLDHGVYKQLDDTFRVDYCQLWNAMILLDSAKIQQLGEQFSVGKYSRYFPLIFTGRTIDSKGGFGRGMSVEEKKKLKEELKYLRMDDVSSFMESLPPDFLTVLRVDALLRSIIRQLGASQQVRLLTYAKFALHGLSSKQTTQYDSSIKSLFSHLNSKLSYLRPRLIIGLLDLLWLMERMRISLVAAYKDLLRLVWHY